jgi:NAD(P)-dependent dehydrogenase (short-subunit alcohol dehydrogenase family)
MKEFKDKVAVITGAASGIGFGIAERCAREGMKVVLAGINLENLHGAEAALAATGAAMLSVRTDVSKCEDIEALAQKTLDAFGAVHLLVNNVGVGAGGAVWRTTRADWQWVMDVNLWSVIYGLDVFVPIMLAQDTECHIVNTSSVAGLLPYHPSAPYQVTKHAVVALSENLHHSLAEQDTKLRVSVLCPGWVRTRIMESGRNRPVELRNEPSSESPDPQREATLQAMHQAVQAGMSVQEVADCVFRALRDDRFWVLTDTVWMPSIRRRMEDILQ